MCGDRVAGGGFIFIFVVDVVVGFGRGIVESFVVAVVDVADLLLWWLLLLVLVLRGEDCLFSSTDEEWEVRRTRPLGFKDLLEQKIRTMFT